MPMDSRAAEVVRALHGNAARAHTFQVWAFFAEVKTMLIIIILILAIMLVPLPAKADDRLAVYYAGPDGSVLTALTSAPSTLSVSK